LLAALSKNSFQIYFSSEDDYTPQGKPHPASNNNASTARAVDQRRLPDLGNLRALFPASSPIREPTGTLYLETIEERAS
jgi:hypothetical protein